MDSQKVVLECCSPVRLIRRSRVRGNPGSSGSTKMDDQRFALLRSASCFRGDDDMKVQRDLMVAARRSKEGLKLETVIPSAARNLELSQQPGFLAALEMTDA